MYTWGIIFQSELTDSQARQQIDSRSDEDECFATSGGATLQLWGHFEKLSGKYFSFDLIKSDNCQVKGQNKTAKNNHH